MNKKFALVTGGAKRIGAELCMVLAKNSYNLLIHYNTSQNEAQELKRRILNNNPNIEVHLFQGDLSQIKKVNELISFIKEKCVYLNVLINNASIFIKQNFLENSQEFISNNINIHLATPLLLSQFFLNQERNNYNEKILINMLDSKRLDNIKKSKIHNYGDYFIYSITKHTQYLFHEYLTKEIEDKKIDSKIFGITLGNILENSDTQFFFQKNNITTNDTNKKITKIHETLDYILKSHNYIKNEVFEIS